jgi:hypothetical protein
MAAGILPLNSAMSSGMATVYHLEPNTLRGVSFSLAWDSAFLDLKGRSEEPCNKRYKEGGLQSQAGKVRKTSTRKASCAVTCEAP